MNMQCSPQATRRQEAGGGSRLEDRSPQIVPSPAQAPNGPQVSLAVGPSPVSVRSSMQSVLENDPTADDHIDALPLAAQDRQIPKRIAIDEQEIGESAGLQHP